jgi:hypothetical protein
MEASKVSIELEDLNGSDVRRGFSAKLNVASLSDLVQLECLSGNACVARVTSIDEVGYLYFRAGRIVHAVSASHVGEAAALEILGWDSGNFEICNAGWPDSESIQGSFQSLLLRAAQTRDEASRPNLLRFPIAKTPAPPAPGRLPSESEETTPPSGVTKVRAAARLDANGQVTMTKGVGADELADATALTLRLAALIGESLGLDRLMAVEATSADQRTLLLLEKDGGALALRAPLDVDVSALRSRYGV